MKKFITFCFTFIIIIFLIGCNKDDNKEDNGYDYDAIPDTMESSSYEIAFITDIGQLKDKSFNQGTWEGLKRYAYEHNKAYKYYQPANGSQTTDDDRYDAMKAAASGGAKIIVCAGYMQGNALKKAAAEFTDVKFIFIDGWTIDLDNVTAVIYKEEQSGYLAGYAAVMEGYTKLGFAGGGGGTNPACQRFGYGYLQGANDAARLKETNISMKYSWLYGSSFSDSPELQTMLEGWYTTGTEVVFACGGSMCKSAFAAAAANNKKVIGVDVDQSNESNTVITSATKGLREGTMYAIGKYYENKWTELANQTVNLGVELDAVGLPTTNWEFKNFTIEEYQTLFNKIKENEIKIDNNPTDAETKEYSNITIDYIK